MEVAAWLSWVDGASLIARGSDPDEPGQYGRAMGCLRFNRKLCTAEYRWGTARWNKDGWKGSYRVDVSFTNGGEMVWRLPRFMRPSPLVLGQIFWAMEAGADLDDEDRANVLRATQVPDLTVAP